MPYDEPWRIPREGLFSGVRGRLILGTPDAETCIGRARGADSYVSPRSTYGQAAHHLVPPHKDTGGRIDRPGLTVQRREGRVSDVGDHHRSVHVGGDAPEDADVMPQTVRGRHGSCS